MATSQKRSGAKLSGGDSPSTTQLFCCVVHLLLCELRFLFKEAHDAFAEKMVDGTWWLAGVGCVGQRLPSAYDLFSCHSLTYEKREEAYAHEALLQIASDRSKCFGRRNWRHLGRLRLAYRYILTLFRLNRDTSNAFDTTFERVFVVGIPT